MLKLSNAVSMLLSQRSDSFQILYWLLIVQIVFFAVEMIVFALLIIRARNKAKIAERVLEELKLDTEIVQKEFIVGEDFNCDGLLVSARYSSAPLSERITKIRKMTAKEYELYKQNKQNTYVNECIVVVPEMAVGTPVVTVVYGEDSAVYAIKVKEPEEEIATVAAPVRTLVGLSLNTENVRKVYTVGEAFSAEGLVLIANFDLDPTIEIVTDFEIQPVDMNRIGTQDVLINYRGLSIGFQISIAPAPVVLQPIVIEEEESFEGGMLRYDRSFTARLIQSEDELKHWYTELKNHVLSYKKVKARMSWKRESFRLGRETVVRLSFRGKTLCAFLPLNYEDYIGTKYKVEEVETAPDEEKLCLYRIKNAKRMKYVLELIDIVMERLSGVKNKIYISEDFYVPYEGLVELINKGLIKRNIKTKQDELVFVQRREEPQAQEKPTEAENPAEEVVVASEEEVAASEEASEVRRRKRPQY